MIDEINLLVNKRDVRFLSPVKNHLKIFRFVGIGVMFLVGVISMILSILIVLSPLPQLYREEQKMRRNISAFQIDMNKLAFVNSRGDTIRKILEQRFSYDKKIDIVMSKIHPDVTLNGLSISGDKYIFKFYSRNLRSLEELLNGLISITGQGREFTRVYLTSLNMDEKNKRFVLVVDLLTI